jgi:lipopolysaccharide transport protein LptA
VEGSAEPAAKPSPGRGLEGGLDLAGFRNDAPIEINAEEAEIVNGDLGRELVFRRNVEVRQANVTLRSDLLEATYLKGRSEPERLVAQGHVLVDQGGRRARCDRAIYQRTAQRLTCAGRAELVQGCDVVRGDSIEFDLADDRARVQGAASIVIRPGDGDGCVDAGGLL